MCTLSFVPIDNRGFVFTTNRDENGKRPTAAPSLNKVGNQILLYPKDLEAYGTWMATNGKDTSVCLLNGAYIKHKRKESYRKSRGVMTLEFFSFTSVSDFLREYCFQGIEPFTLVVVEHEEQLDLHEIRWDGDSLHYRKLDGNMPCVWSSTTLYPKDIAKIRESWFHEWLNSGVSLNQEEILKFHHRGGAEDAWNGLIMNRNNIVKTISISSIQWKQGKLEMFYEDLQKGTQGLYRYDQKRYKDSITT